MPMPTQVLPSSLMPIALRPARPADSAFCRRIKNENMRWIAEQLFGWDEAQQVERFARQWNVDEVRIITAAAEDAGWLQTATVEDAVFLKQIYMDRPFQRQGIGTRVMRIVIDGARQDGKAVALDVVKINPARRLYERLGFRITGEEDHKFNMRREPDGAA